MSETTHSTIETEVKGRDDQFTQAAIDVDTGKLQSIMSDNYVFITGNGEKLDRADHIASLTSRHREYKSLKFVEVEVRPFQDGNMAVLTGRLAAVGSVNELDASGDYLVTRVYVKQGEQWTIVSGQATRAA